MSIGFQHGNEQLEIFFFFLIYLLRIISSPDDLELLLSCIFSPDQHPSDKVSLKTKVLMMFLGLLVCASHVVIILSIGECGSDKIITESHK